MDSPARARVDSVTGGMRLVFWTWMSIIFVGLTVMIAVPLAGA